MLKGLAPQAKATVCWYIGIAWDLFDIRKAKTAASPQEEDIAKSIKYILVHWIAHG